MLRSQSPTPAAFLAHNTKFLHWGYFCFPANSSGACYKQGEASWSFLCDPCLPLPFFPQAHALVSLSPASCKLEEQGGSEISCCLPTSGQYLMKCLLLCGMQRNLESEEIVLHISQRLNSLIWRFKGVCTFSREHWAHYCVLLAPLGSASGMLHAFWEKMNQFILDVKACGPCQSR